ncbi:hypothetical protein V2W45_1226812, partial [Cenococcum geophilum]
IPYEVPNLVGKMTTEVYTKVVLFSLQDELLDYGLTLYYNADLAYISKAIIKWAKDNGVSLITLPGVSPDFSILKLMAHPIKRKFYAKRCTIEKAALARFRQLSEEEMD